MIITLKKGKASLAISSLGAEPQSFIREGIEYIWQGDPAFWPRHAPLLFPMSGPTKDSKISAKGKVYDMPNNGFARETEFTGTQLCEDTAQFVLEDSPALKERYYPYGFILTVTYTLDEDGYTAKAEVTAKEDLYYTFAWHPAFSLDINGKGTDLETYSLSFEENEELDRKYQIAQGFVTEPRFLVGDSIDFTRKETDKGPIVLEGVKSREVTLTSSEGEHGVTVFLGDMSTLVCWTKEQVRGQFLCIEPMVSFGFNSRPLEIENMSETRFLEKGKTEKWENRFTFF